MIKLIHFVGFLFLVISITSCSSARFFKQTNPKLAVINESGAAELPNLTDFSTDALYEHCLLLPKSTDIELVLLTHCTKELLSRDDLSPMYRSYGVSTYNFALYTLVTTDKKLSDIKKKVTLNYSRPINFTFSDEMIAIDNRLKPKFFGEIGIPIVTNRNNQQLGVEVYYPLEGILRDATIVMTQVKIQGDSFKVSLDILFHNDKSTIEIGSNNFLLRHSPGSAFLALIEKANIDDYNWLGFVSPSQAEKRRGVFAIGDISKDKIPIIMVHGLNSNPLIWKYLTMSILNEPTLVARYQVWHIYYPSGPPPFYSASRTRDNLRSLLKELNSPTLADQAVIIGHSMGGIISKLLATKTNFALWDTAFNKRPDKLLPAVFTDVQNIFVFEPVFKKSDLFFLDTPFKGSEVANSTIAYLGAFLVTLPGEFTRLFQDFIKRVGPHVITAEMQPFLLDYGPNSIQVLRPGHPLMNTLYDLPISGDAYAIIGSNSALKCQVSTTCADISDGVVSYDSANYRYAKEHIIAPSSHDSFQSKEAINFILHKLKTM